MSGFIITIRADVNSAMGSTKELGKSLDALEQRGKAAGTAISSGARQGSIEMDKAKRSAEGLSGEMQRMVGFAKALGAIALAKQVADLSDGYTTLQNRLRSVSDSQKDLNNLMRNTHTIADATRSDWKAVGEAYVRFRVATRDLGISQQQLLGLTETMSKGLRLGGASAQEANMSMMELSHAFQTGSLTGREFRVLMKDASPLMAELAKASGHTAAEFAEMGKHGKISAELLVEWFGKAKEAIDEKFAKTVPTISDQWQVFHNQLLETAGQITSNANLLPALTAALQALAAGLKQVADGLGPVLGLLGGLGEHIGVLKTVGEAVSWVTAPMTLSGWIKIGKAIKGTDDASISVYETLKKVNDEFERQRTLTAQGTRGWYALAAGAMGFADALDNTATKLSRFLPSPHKREKSSGPAPDIQFAAEGHTRNVIYEDDRRRENIGIGGSLVDPMLQAQVDTMMQAARRLPDEIDRDSKRAIEQLNHDWAAGLAAYETKWGEVRSTVASVFDDIGNTMIDFIVDGKNGFADLTKSIEKAILKLLLLQGIQGITGGSGASSAGGALATKLFGFAEGGSFTVGGSGGTDTQPVAFMATPGEQVTVTPAGQANGPGGAARQSGGGDVYVVADMRAAAIRALHSAEGKAAIRNVIQDSGGLIRSHITKR